MTYEYDNLHGWLTRMRAGCGFVQKLYRESGALNNRFNGSISAMTWRITDSGKTRRYDYTYDELNRLTEAVYSEKNNNNAFMLAPKPSFDDVLRGKAPVTLIPTALNDYDCNNHYTELVEYDANSNITGLQRYGMLNDRSFGLIDDLSIDYNGNQRKSVEDDANVRLTYSGAFDFVDGVSGSKEYSYNENGALTKDSNKGITSISYDLLGNPLKVTMKDGNNIEYVYAADGTRLKATHNTKLSAGRYSSRDRYYRGNLIFVRSNDKLPYTVLVPGGYYFYESADEAFYLSLYVQDYQGNIRAELFNGNSVFDQTHYYPFGGVIGDLSSPSSFNAGNEFKFSGKELDRNFGLDLYDFHARQYGADVPWFTRPDDHAEKYYSVSPYAYCAGNPVNFIDPTGCDSIFALSFWRGEVRYIGDDGKSTNNVYVVKGKVKRAVMAATKKGEKYTGKLNDYNKVAVIVRGDAANQVNEDYEKANGPEQGGCVYQDGTVQSWDKGTEPKEVQNADGSSSVSHSIAPFYVNGVFDRKGDPVSSWHIHSQLDYKTKNNGVVYLGNSNPSRRDYNYESNNNTGSTFVVGQRDGTVQYYHNGSNTISMSWKVWKRLAGLK